MVFSIVAMSRPTSAQCSARMSSRPRTSSTVPARVPGVGPQRHGPQRLLRPGPADEDRQVGLDRSRLAQRVVERVEAALVAEPLAVEQAADEHHRLVEPVEPLADGPGSRCRRRRARVRTRRRRCRGRPGRPRGGRGSSRAWRCGPGCGTCWPRPSARAGPACERREPGEHAPALEDRLLPRPEDGHEVVPRPDASPSRRPRRRGPRRGSPPSRSAATRAGARSASSSSRWSWMAVGADPEADPLLRSKPAIVLLAIAVGPRRRVAAGHRRRCRPGRSPGR